MPALVIAGRGLNPQGGKLIVCSVGARRGCSLRFATQPMPLTITQKQELINGHQTHGTDTGSVEVQVATSPPAKVC